MKDETYVFISDVKEKGSIGRSARNRKTHAGKGGRVRLPSDNLSKKELQKMSGECKSYRLNEPMAWKEFKAMPDDLKVTYINLLRGKYGVPDGEIASMMGVHKVNFSKEMSQIKARIGDSFQKRTGEYDKDGFYAWANGVAQLSTPVIEEPIQEEQLPVITSVEPEPYVEEDLPFEEPDCAFTFVPMAQCQELEAENALMKAQIDGLQKANDALMAANEKDKQKIEWLENRVNDLELERHILEKQMEIVRLIFGGANRC